MEDQNSSPGSGIHSVFFIRNSNFFQAASFLIFNDFEPGSFLISFLNSLDPGFEMCWLKNHRFKIGMSY